MIHYIFPFSGLFSNNVFYIIRICINFSLRELLLSSCIGPISMSKLMLEILGVFSEPKIPLEALDFII